MTPRSATTRRASFTALGTCICFACAPRAGGPPRDAHQWLRAFCSIRFASPHEITLISSRSAPDPGQSRLMTVVELGGRVVAYRGDTLVLEPYYLTTAAGSADRITAYRGGQAGFPDAALVAIDGAVDIGGFHSPRRPRSPDEIVAVALGMGMMLTLLYADVVMLLHL